MKWVNWGGGHCDWPISKWGCLIGGGLWHILINWGGRIQRIQKTMASDKKGLSNWGGIFNPVFTLHIYLIYAKLHVQHFAVGLHLFSEEI